MLYEDEYPCHVWKENWNELFHHFKNVHYNEEAEIRQARQLFYEYYVSTNISSKTSEAEEKENKKKSIKFTSGELESRLKHVKNRLKWRDTLMQRSRCFIYEANIIDSAEYTGPTKQNRPNQRKDMLFYTECKKYMD